MKEIKKLWIVSSLSFLLISLIAFEGVSYYILVIRGDNFYLPLQLKTVDAPAVKEKFAEAFSYELGWEPYRTTHGYRGAEKELSQACVSLFGDSFTKGYPILEQSWPYLLEQKIGNPVLNFGVGGYGTDQALWRFEQYYLDKITTPYFVLGIMSQNISRIVNRYRGFLTRKVKIGATKPMYSRTPNGSFTKLPNPLKSADEIEKLKNADFLQEIGLTDYWYQHFEQYNLNHQIHFPYSYFMLKAMPYYIVRYYNRKIKKDYDADHKVLYNTPDVSMILEYIIFQFITQVKEHDATPIILFFPNRKDLVDYQQAGKTVYEDFSPGLVRVVSAAFESDRAALLKRLW